MNGVCSNFLLLLEETDNTLLTRIMHSLNHLKLHKGRMKDITTNKILNNLSNYVLKVNCLISNISKHNIKTCRKRRHLDQC